MNSPTRIVLGIDPGYGIVGYGVLSCSLHDTICKDYGVITTPSHLPLSERIGELSKKLREILSRVRPDLVAIEKIFFFSNQKTAIDVSQARGGILLTIQEHHIPIIELTPLQVKQTVTGYGRAGKGQVQQMVKLLLNLTEIPRPDDAADALAIAISGWRFYTPARSQSSELRNPPDGTFLAANKTSVDDKEVPEAGVS